MARNGVSADAPHQFRGCSTIADYEVIDKLGEGTFGYGTNVCAWPARLYGGRSLKLAKILFLQCSSQSQESTQW